MMLKNNQNLSFSVSHTKEKHQIQNQIRQFLRKTNKFKLNMTHATSTIGHKFKYKDQQSLLYITGAVYRLSCSCGELYVGQPKRNLKFWLNEHKPSNLYKSDVGKHLLENPSTKLILIIQKFWRMITIGENSK